MKNYLDALLCAKKMSYRELKATIYYLDTRCAKNKMQELHIYYAKQAFLYELQKRQLELALELCLEELALELALKYDLI